MLVESSASTLLPSTAHCAVSHRLYIYQHSGRVQTAGQEEDPPPRIKARRGKKLSWLQEAVRIAYSEDTTADRSDNTSAAFQQKHPQPHSSTLIPALEENLHHISVLVEEIAHSFPCGSAGAWMSSDLNILRTC